MTKPVVVQHSFGNPGTGGPITALGRVLDSDLTSKYQFVRMHQERATGGIDRARLKAWVSMLRRVEPDLVHVRGLGNEGFHAALAARWAGCPRVLVSVHGTVRDLVHARGAKHRVVRDVLEPLTLRMATHVTTVCRSAARRDYMRPYASKFVGPMTNGVELPDLSASARKSARLRLGIHEGDLVFVNVGRLTWEKGHRSLAEALSEARMDLPPEALLLIVGDGPDRAEIESLYRGTGFRTRFLGRRMDVPDILRASDVFVFPSLHENLSNALLEALAFGLPAIATRVGGNVEVLEYGGGRLVPPNDPFSLASALVTLSTDARARAQASGEARATIEASYSIDRMTETLDSIYSTILRS